MQSRSLFLDNARGILIFLVVFGHAIEPLIGRFEIAQTLYAFIYAFHMPAFVLLAGYLSKTELRNKEYASIFNGLILTYLIAQLAYRVAEAYWTGQTFNTNVTTPYWLLWFMLSLIAWRMILPLWMTLRWPLVSAIALALIAGSMKEIGYFLSLSRTIYYFPFFILGAILAQRGSIPVPTIPIRIIAIFTLAAALCAAIYFAAQNLPNQLFYGSFSYSALGQTTTTGALIRFGMYATAAIIGLAFAALVPTKNTVFASMGRRSLPIYILHGFIIKSALAYGLYDHISSQGMLLALAVVSFALCMILKTTLCNQAFAQCISLFGTTRLLMSPQRQAS